MLKNNILGEILLISSASNEYFNISEYILESLRKDLIYSGPTTISELLTGTFESQSFVLNGTLGSSLSLENHLLWHHSFEKDICVRKYPKILPSNSFYQKLDKD